MMNYLHSWAEAIRFRWRSVAIATAIVVVSALVYLAVAPRTYSATATLFFDKDAPDPLREDEKSAQVRVDGLKTEADIIRSSAVAQKVAEDLNLAADPGIRREWENDGRHPLQQWLTQWVLDSVNVESDNQTRVITLEASARDPDLAARLANAYAAASTAKMLSLKTEAASGYLGWLTKEVGLAAQRVTEAESQLRRFVAATGVTNNGNLSADADRAANIAVQSAMARAEAAAAHSTHGAPQLAGADAEKSIAIQNIRSQLAEKQAEANQLASTLGPQHPNLQSARATVSTLEQTLEREVSASNQAFRAARSVEISSRQSSAGAAAGLLSAAASSQSGRLVEMSKGLGRMATLQTELTTAQRHQADLQGRLAQMQLQTNLPQSKVAKLDNAQAPLMPSSPKAGLLLSLALIFGFLIGAIIAIIREAMNPYARTPASLQRLLGIPVIPVTLPRPSMRQLVDARKLS